MFDFNVNDNIQIEVWCIIKSMIQNLFDDICFKTEMNDDVIKNEFHIAVDHLTYSKNKNNKEYL